MTKNIPIKLVSSLLATGYLIGAPAFAASVVSGDLITSSNLTTAWQECVTDSVAADVTSLDAAACAYRTTPVTAGVTYSLTCGITVVDFASITLAFLDENADTLATQSTEVLDLVSGPYSVTLQAPANTVTGAIGIYGEPGSGFQDCVLVDATPVETPTKGRIGGVTWFDENGDSVFNDTENFITSTPVSLLSEGVEIKQFDTKVVNGRFYFGNLDLDQCYTVSFGTADSTLELAATGGDNDAGANGISEEVCLTSDAPYEWHVDAAYVNVAPVEAPGDYVICGNAWHDVDGSGRVSSGDTRILGTRVRLYDGENNFIKTIDNVTGNYVFTDLSEGDYKIQIINADGYEPIESFGSIAVKESYVQSNGRTPSFNLPADGNSVDGHTCTIQHVNGLYTKTEVALDQTIANDDTVTGVAGVTLRSSILENDDACDGVLEVGLISHDVPGTVYFNSTNEKFVIVGSTDAVAGEYSVEYGLRGVCGSYDTATISVTLTEPEPVVADNAPDAPMCRVETGNTARWAGVDVFSDTENGFASGYNFYDRDKNLVIAQTSENNTFVILRDDSAATTGANAEAYIGQWEMEWNAAEFGYDNTAIYYVSAIEDGVESALTECPRDLMSPIALDLENQGRIQQIVGSFEVDLDNDGIKEALSRWFAPSAGILVNDNASGKITGQDLYGNIPGVYADGFEELATLDVNADGQLTNKELVGLAIWTDLNSDTMVDASELSSLADHSIVSLAVNHKKFMARAKLSSGKTMLMEDVWLPYAPLAQLAK